MRVGVFVGVEVGENFVGVFEGVKVFVGVMVGVLVGVFEGVKVFVGVLVRVLVGAFVGVLVGVSRPRVGRSSGGSASRGRRDGRGDAGVHRSSR